MFSRRKKSYDKYYRRKKEPQNNPFGFGCKTNYRTSGPISRWLTFSYTQLAVRRSTSKLPYCRVEPGTPGKGQ